MDQQTTELFRDDSYLKHCTAVVTAIDERGVQLDQTIFYPHSGGQLGDTGEIQLSNGISIPVTDTQKDKTTSELIHQVQDPSALAVGDEIALQINWTRRYSLMRFHSCLHLLCAAVDAPVNGGSIQQDRARLDFDLKEPLDKQALTDKLNEYIERDAAITSSWISDSEFDAKPELVRTMSVKPPRNPQGTIRLVEIDGIDLQACGGTHVASTKEIGAMLVRKIENKGKQNRRITVVAAET